MDLSASPDLDARICYGIVFLCALLAGWFQIYQRLSAAKITGIWLVHGTWLLFGIYVLTPLALFWLMDRFSALNDTSLFSALLVGLAYPAVLAGGFGGLKAPSGLSGIFKPVEAFTDAITKSVVANVARNDNRFEDFVVTRMRNNPEVLKELENIALSHALHGPKLQQELDAIDAAAQQAGNPKAVWVQEQKSRAIYLYISSIPDFLKLIADDKRIFGGKDRWMSPVWRTRLVTCGAIVLLVAIVALAVSVFNSPQQKIRYATWRLAKPNNSEKDRFRAREALRTYLEDSKTAALTAHRLAVALRSPDLPVDRMDLALQLLLECRLRGHLSCSDLVPMLIESLRSDNSDKRTRVHQALLFVALELDPGFKSNRADLVSWQPTEGDSITSLENRIAAWKLFCTNAFLARPSSRGSGVMGPN